MTKNKPVRMAVAVLSIVLLCFSLFSLYAAAEAPDEASLVLTYSSDMSGTSVRLYYAASVDSNGEYVISPDFKKSGVSLKKEENMSVAAYSLWLYSVAEDSSASALEAARVDNFGYAVFPKLKTGLYLVVTEDKVNGESIYYSAPFLISLPFYDEATDEWQYDAVAQPKYEEGKASDNAFISVSAVKIWEDKGNQTTRDSFVTVKLYRDGKVYDTVELNEANFWRHTWTALPADHLWTVLENDVPVNYTVSYSGKEYSYVVKNTYSGSETPEETTTGTPTDGGKLPNTGLLQWPVPVLSTVGLLFFGFGWSIYNRKSRGA